MSPGMIGGISSLVQLPLSLGAAGEEAARQVYAQAMRKGQEADKAMLAMRDGTMKIAQLKQQKVLSSMDIAKNQREAEAMARVNAAVTGTEGGAVDQVIQMTEVNEVTANYAMSKDIEGQIAQSVRDIEGAAYGLSGAMTPAYQGSNKFGMMSSIFGASSSALQMFAKGGLF